MVHGNKKHAIKADRDKGLSFGGLAKKHGLSKSRCFEVVKRFEDFGKVARAKQGSYFHRPRTMADVTVEMFLATAAMTEYPAGRLLRVLEPFVADLQMLGGKSDYPRVTRWTVERELERAFGEDGYLHREPTDKRTLVVHGLPVELGGSAEKARRCMLLCLVETSTGFAAISAMQKQVRPSDVTNCILEFLKRFQASVEEVRLVTQLQGLERREVATAIRVGKEDLARNLEEQLRARGVHLRVQGGKKPMGNKRTIRLQGVAYEGLHEVLRKGVNKYNRVKRASLRSKAVPEFLREITPADRLWRIVAQIPNKSYFRRETFMQKILFPAG